MTAKQNESPTVAADDGVRLWAARSGSGDPWGLRAFGAAGHRSPDARPLRRRSRRRTTHFGLERIRLLGHSWGAQLALSYALAHPERVSLLVYVSGTGIGPDAD
ncbi:alpha/beta fold hydrolase [Streptomyces sp. NPDC001604]|uniref:alpha/beta fold hydrolase n=1 Tax=Streptomyces sp. NPDC001604 TaxID=3364593 RepID=UPI003687A830